MKSLRLICSALALRLADAYLVAPPGTAAPGAISTCSAWVQDSYGLTCDIITRVFGMTLAQFEEWNTSVTLLGDGCNMIEGLYYCVEINYISYTTSTTASQTTSTSSASAVTTPTPTQTGMIDNCNSFYEVVSGDSCANIATAQGIPLGDFYTWNPAVGSSCGNLWAGYYVCVGVSSSATTTATSITTTTSGTAVVTPTPIQTGMISTCKTFHLVVSGDSCYDIAVAAGCSLSDFYSWNTVMGTSCASLWPGYYVCIAIL